MKKLRGVALIVLNPAGKFLVLDESRRQLWIHFKFYRAARVFFSGLVRIDEVVVF